MYTKYNPADVRWDVLNHTMSQYNLHYNHILWLKGLHLTCPSPHWLCLQITCNFRSRHFINCSQIPSLSMQWRQSLHSSLCVFRFDHAQWPWIMLLSTEARALRSFPHTMFTENVSYWCPEPDSGSQHAIYAIKPWHCTISKCQPLDRLYPSLSLYSHPCSRYAAQTRQPLAMPPATGRWRQPLGV